MRNDDNFINEFVALSKCLPMLIDKVDGESTAQAALREPLAAAIMTRMQSLLETAPSAPVVSAEKTHTVQYREVPLLKVREGTMTGGAATDIAGERALCQDQLDTAERQLVQERLRTVVQNQLHSVDKETSNGLMIDCVYDDGVEFIQAYIVPDPDQQDQEIHMFRFRLDLQDPAK